MRKTALDAVDGGYDLEIPAIYERWEKLMEPERAELIKLREEIAPIERELAAKKCARDFIVAPTHLPSLTP